MLPLWKTEALLDTGLELLQVWKRELIEKIAVLIVVGVAGFVTLAAFAAGTRLTVRAASPAIASAQSFTMRGHSVTVMPGSMFANLVVGDEHFTITLAEGDAVTFRLSGYGQFWGVSEAVAGCRQHEGFNYLTVSIPGVHELTVENRSCDSSGPVATTISGVQLQAGEGVASGTEQMVFWQTNGSVQSVRVSLSVDGGVTFPDVLADSLLNDGAFLWSVPSSQSSTRAARIRVDGLGGQDEIIAFGVSRMFTIDGTTPESSPEDLAHQVPPDSSRAYDADEATRAASTIGTDRHISTAPSGSVIRCAVGARIRGASSSAVYYCGADGRRYGFPNQHVHDSWYQGFEGIVVITDDELAMVPLGGTVTYRPGVRMVKITTDPKVYAVAANGELRWVSSEAVAERLYGPAWNTFIDDLPDAFFADYHIGTPIE